MAIITKLDNVANIIQDGVTTTSNTVSTIILLEPTIVKTVDKNFANRGEIVSYSITISNISLQAMTYLEFSDSLPEGCTYMVDTFRVDNVVKTPTITDNTITYTIDSIDIGGTTTITFQVTVD